MTDPIVAFLTARLDEDEATAREASAPFNPEQWFADIWYDGTPSKPPGDRSDVQAKSSGWVTQHGALETQHANHIARFAPARVLADVAAKRAILRLHGDQHDCGDAKSWEYPYVGCATLRALVGVHRDHPDFDPLWT